MLLVWHAPRLACGCRDAAARHPWHHLRLSEALSETSRQVYWPGNTLITQRALGAMLLLRLLACALILILASSSSGLYTSGQRHRRQQGTAAMIVCMMVAWPSE